MADNESSRNLVKPAAGILGILATIASVWWFALRPRRKKSAD
jgi:cbb3-type cytochrome oxidase subunit 3